MTEKSHVSLEQHVCWVCGSTYDTGGILIDKRLRACLDRFTITGWGLCPAHQDLFEKGFIALVEFDPAQSGDPLPGDRVQPQKAYRTGTVMHVRRAVAAEVFNISLDPELPCVFVEIGAIEKLQALIEAAVSS
jgi:hypothetical protein